MELRSRSTLRAKRPRCTVSAAAADGRYPFPAGVVRDGKATCRVITSYCESPASNSSLRLPCTVISSHVCGRGYYDTRRKDLPKHDLAPDPANHLVAGELERPWNEMLERAAQLERAYAQAE